MRNGFWDSRTNFGRAVRRHDALDALTVGIGTQRVSWVLDADIQGFFDNIGHQWLLQLLEDEIAGRRILGLIRNGSRPRCRSRASGPRRSRARRPEAVILPGDITAAGERVLALCFGFVGASLAGELGVRLGHTRAVRGRFRARIRAPKRGPEVSGGTPGTAGEVRARAASGQDTADRVGTLGASQAGEAAGKASLKPAAFWGSRISARSTRRAGTLWFGAGRCL